MFHPIAFSLFRRFLQIEHSEENLDFWIDTERLFQRVRFTEALEAANKANAGSSKVVVSATAADLLLSYSLASSSARSAAATAAATTAAALATKRGAGSSLEHKAMHPNWRDVQLIACKYVDDKAVRQVNLSNNNRSLFMEAFRAGELAPALQALEVCQEEVAHLLRGDSFRRFKEHESWAWLNARCSLKRRREALLAMVHAPPQAPLSAPGAGAAGAGAGVAAGAGAGAGGVARRFTRMQHMYR